MLKYLQPDLYVASVADIDLSALSGNGIRALIIDLDNTLLPWRERRSNAVFVETLQRLTESGFKICIVSNARDNRVKSLFSNMAIPAISRAGKPRKSAFRRAMELLDTSAAETAVIGDQLFTDVLGGKRMGLYTILVIPISKKEFIGTQLIRRVEKRVLNHFYKKGVLTKPGRN